MFPCGPATKGSHQDLNKLGSVVQSRGAWVKNKKLGAWEGKAEALESHIFRLSALRPNKTLTANPTLHIP